jgi:hypothetical protein
MECLDRIYLNAYVPNLQVAGQVVVFLTQHLGNPIPPRRCSPRSATRSGLRSSGSPPPTRSPWFASPRTPASRR